MDKEILLILYKITTCIVSFKRKLKETKEIKIVVLKVNKHNAKSPPAVAVENSSLRKPYNGQKSASRSNCE